MRNLLLFISILFISSCCQQKEELKVEEEFYSFVVAGHVYGHSDHYTSSIYPPFLDALDSLIRIKKPDRLILTGDVVAHPTEENWETVRYELDARKIEWTIAPGNHDISVYMDQEIQQFKYKAYREAGNLLMTTNTSHPGWCPDSLQRIFIAENLSDLDSIDNIFIFSHQLWWEKDPPMEFDIDSIRPNSYAGFDGEDSFWEKVFFPYLDSLENDIYFLAGDMGCHEVLPSYFEDHYKNFHFYGSGMGGGLTDNFLYIKTYADGRVEIERVDF